MSSPARRHYLRTTAALAAVAGTDPDTLPPATANAYELMLVQLAEHRRQLKSIQSIERKIAAKAEMIPAYTDWVSGVLQSGRGGQDEVLVTVMLWHIDTGDLDGALPLVEYALHHGLSMPDHYKRNLPCVVAEEFADHALQALAAEQPVAAPPLLRAAELTADADMPDEVRAKLNKAIGYAQREAAPAEALAHLKAALALHDKVGVKRDIELLERALRKSAADITREQQNTPPATEHDPGQG